LQNGLSGLPPRLRDRFSSNVIKGRPGLLPILVTGAQEPINLAVIRALAHTLHTQVDSRAKLRVLTKLDLLLRAKTPKITDQLATTLIQEANDELIGKGRATGLLIILDELGKFLEFAAQNPE